MQTCASCYTKEQYKICHPYTQGMFFSHLPIDDRQLCHIKKNKNSLRKGWCKARIMFHHSVNRLMVANLTKCKPVHHITPREHTKCVILIHTRKIRPWNRGLSYYHDSPTPKWIQNQMPTNGLHGPSNIIRSLRNFEEAAGGRSFIAYKVNFILSVCPLLLH